MNFAEYIKQTVDPVKFYQSIIPDLNWSAGSSEARTNCIFHKDNNTPSLHMNSETGKWYCHGCDIGGNSIISFYARLHDLTASQACRAIFDQFIHPTISDKKIRQYRRQLLRTPTAVEYLANFRLLTQDIIDQYSIGWDGSAIAIPIYNEWDLCVNVKFHNPEYKRVKVPKMFNYRERNSDRKFGKPAMIYPIEVFEWAKKEGYIVLCEGEWDTLFLLSLSIPAVTSTAGDKSWPKQYNELFRGLNVITAYDNDKTGMVKKYVLPNLRNLALSIKTIQIPKIEHVKDVLSWARHDKSMRRRSSWSREIKEAKIVLQNSRETVEQSEKQIVPLDQASQAKWFNKPIQVNALITGKASPYLLPKKFRITCNQKCDLCPLKDRAEAYREGKFSIEDPRLLRLMDVKDSQITANLLAVTKMPCESMCEPKVDILETLNVEPVYLIPTLDSKSMQHVTREAFYVGHGLYPNRSYCFDGTTIPHPKDQQSTHLFTKARPIQDEVDTFQMTQELRNELRIFQPRGRQSIRIHLNHIAEWQSHYITKIRNRPDLHILVDLAYHSVTGFEFNSEFVRRGMLDVLILGDTRCGKGFVAEGLSRYYNLGEIASGENCTFAGLIAGVQQISKRWIITWGVIPLNHNRLVIIDEASSLSETDFSILSRVRSEGIAEVTKVVREVTPASTRLIWLSNTRSGQKVRKYAKGVLAVKELVGANEDISRFDLALIVAADEVPAEVINAPAIAPVESAKYPQHLCKALVLWAWSRRPDQINFSQAAVNRIISEAIKLGHQYSSDIPLIQSENVRIKLAKISAAVAARVFSTTTGEDLQIEEKHVECAVEIIHEFYSKPSMGYDVYSRQTRNASTLHDVKSVEQLFESFGKERIHVIRGLNEVYRISPDSLGDFVGDNNTARTIISDLVKLNCLTRAEKGGNWYTKNAEFSEWVSIQIEMANKHKENGHVNGKPILIQSDAFDRNRRF